MFFVLDENNNKVEALDKEGVFATLEQAIADGSLANLVADASFVSKLKCCVSGVTNSVAFVTQATYNNLVAQGTVKANTYYFITDDPTFDEVEELVVSLNNKVVELDEKVNSISIKKNANGVLLVDGIVVPQKKLLFNSDVGVQTVYPHTFTLLEAVAVGDVLEIKVGLKVSGKLSAVNFIKFAVTNIGDTGMAHFEVTNGPTTREGTVFVTNNTTLMIMPGATTDELYLYKVYKVIE